MKLKIMLPGEVLLEEKVSKITAEATNGFFTLLPRHIDFVAPIVRSILSYDTLNGTVEYVAIDTGILVKKGFDVSLSTTRAIQSDDIEKLEDLVENQWQVLEESEKKAQSAIAKLELDALQHFIQWGSELK